MKTKHMLHAKTNIELNRKINSRGNKEQHHAISCNRNPKVVRRGVWVFNNKHLTAKTGCGINFFEFY
jgi:hypothetical protein